MHYVVYVFYHDGDNPDNIMNQFCTEEYKRKTLVYDKEGLLAETRGDWKYVEEYYPEFKGKQDDDDAVIKAAKKFYGEYVIDKDGNAYEWYNPNGYYDWCIRPSDSWFRFKDWANVDGQFVKDVINEMKSPYSYVDLECEWSDADSYSKDMKEKLEKEFWDKVKSYDDDVRVAVYDCHE